jgi:hypothetical protein
MTPVLELIEWRDIVSHSTGWLSREDISQMETWPMFTVGYVIEETEDTIKVVSTHSHPKHDDITYGHDTIIPKGAVTRRKILRKRWWL